MSHWVVETFIVKGCEMMSTVHSPYQEDLKVLIKSSNFSSLNLRPWVMVQAESNSQSPAQQPDAQQTDRATSVQSYGWPVELYVTNIEMSSSGIHLLEYNYTLYGIFFQYRPVSQSWTEGITLHESKLANSFTTRLRTVPGGDSHMKQTGMLVVSLRVFRVQRQYFKPPRNT